jgi:hypothetical protein
MAWMYGLSGLDVVTGKGGGESRELWKLTRKVGGEMYWYFALRQ